MVSVCSWFSLASSTLTRLLSLAPGREAISSNLATASERQNLVAAEPRLARLGTQIAQQRLVMHPIHGRLGVGVEHRAGTGGQGQEVALLPLDQLAVDRREAAPEEHVVQLRGGVRAGVDLLTGADAHEVGQQRGTGRRTGLDTQLRGQVQRNHTGRLIQVDVGSELGDRNLRRISRADRVGGLGVLEVAGVVGPVGEPALESVLGHVGHRRGNRRIQVHGH